MKKSVFRSNKKFFHVCLDFTCHFLFKELDWLFIQKKVNKYSKLYEIEIHALLMMDSHIHLIIACFDQNENFFNEQLQTAINISSKNENLAEPILNYSQYLNTYKYIYRNPVEVGICKSVQSYPYSAINALLGNSILYCTIEDQVGLIQNPFRVLNWLNHKQIEKLLILENQFN